MTQKPENRFVRLNKALALAGICSRRKADQWIKNGLIKVNQETVQELGYKIDPGQDRIQVQDRELPLIAEQEARHIYLALHKPVYVISSLFDPQHRTCLPDLLPAELRQSRLVPAGRLDYMSEGLLILSTDGDLIQCATHPSGKNIKTYQLLIREEVQPAQLSILRQGMRLKEGELLAPVKARILRPEKNQGLWLEIKLSQGVNRQIRRICRDLGLTVLRLIRTRHGPVSLGSLQPGQFRALTSKEIYALKRVKSSSGKAYGDKNAN